MPAEQASAHAGLEASVPSANAILETGPPNIELDFNEAVDSKLADIELYDQTAKLIATGPPERITDDTVVQVVGSDNRRWCVCGGVAGPVCGWPRRRRSVQLSGRRRIRDSMSAR